MAFLRPAVPSTAVYLVNPLLMAWMAAVLICAGVSKSGSPAPRPIMSLPAARMAAALAVMARVGDGLTDLTLLDSVKLMIPREKLTSKYCLLYTKNGNLLCGVFIHKNSVLTDLIRCIVLDVIVCC